MGIFGLIGSPLQICSLRALSLTESWALADWAISFNPVAMRNICILSLALATLCGAFADGAQDKEIKKAIAALKEGIALLEENQIDDGAEEIRWGLELIDKAK